jgi:hypothetical protein
MHPTGAFMRSRFLCEALKISARKSFFCLCAKLHAAVVSVGVRKCIAWLWSACIGCLSRASASGRSATRVTEFLPKKEVD